MRRRLLLLAIPLYALAGTARPAAASPSPAGLWRQVDDETGAAQSLVRLFEQGGKLYGRIERILIPSETGRTCVDCPGDMRGQKVLGLVFLRGLVPDGAEWSGGRIVDPKTGKTYRCKLRVATDGRTLTIRGYVGVSLLGRSQTWTRLE